MIINKKKNKIIILIATSIVLLAIIIIACISIISYVKVVPYNKINVSGDMVDNDYNNLISGGDLVRIDDNLYFNYKNNGLKYGLFQINKNGSNRIFWHGSKWPADQYLLSPIRIMDDKILSSSSECVQAYSFQAQDFEKSDIVKYAPNFSINFQKNGNKVFYMAYDGNSTTGSIWLYNDKTCKKLIDGDVLSFYVRDDEIFFLELQDQYAGSKKILKKYDIGTGLKESIMVFEYDQIFSFIIENSFIVFEAFDYGNKNEHGVYKINMENKYLNTEKVFVYNDDINSINVYNNHVYISTNKGVKRFNLSTNEELTLCKNFAQACYIVDNKWVYFVDKSSVLYRVTQDGTITEKVFG